MWTRLLMKRRKRTRSSEWLGAAREGELKVVAGGGGAGDEKEGLEDV